jgi:flagellar motor protein MotB
MAEKKKDKTTEETPPEEALEEVVEEEGEPEPTDENLTGPIEPVDPPAEEPEPEPEEKPKKEKPDVNASNDIPFQSLRHKADALRKKLTKDPEDKGFQNQLLKNLEQQAGLVAQLLIKHRLHSVHKTPKGWRVEFERDNSMWFEANETTGEVKLHLDTVNLKEIVD